MDHKTPLISHLKQLHLWFDIIILLILFVVAYYVPLLKIVPLVATLELFSFFSFHLFAKRSSLSLQGFFGGFISSTAVFVQILYDKKFASLHSLDVTRTLILALCAMILECVFILFYFSTQLPFIYYLPFFLQLGFFITIFFLIQRYSQSKNIDSDSPNMDIELLIDHPIIWKNVAKLSFFIIVMVSIMHFIGNGFGLSREISTLIISFFEAHAVLAAIMFEWSLKPANIDLLEFIFLILLGNTLSKSYLAYKGRNLVKKWPFIFFMFANLVISIIITMGWIYMTRLL